MSTCLKGHTPPHPQYFLYLDLAYVYSIENFLKKNTCILINFKNISHIFCAVIKYQKIHIKNLFVLFVT